MRPLSRSKFLNSRSKLAVAILLVLASSSSVFAASTEKVLHSFCKKADCVDGSKGDLDETGLATDQNGTLYGVARSGGKNQFGVAFSLVPNANKSEWTYHILQNFCAWKFCSDGSNPVGELIIETA